MWAISSVPKPNFRLGRRTSPWSPLNQSAKSFQKPKKATNKRHMDTPVTISAFMTGMLLTVIRGLRHLRRMLERPMAAKVPATVAMTVESRDTSSVV